VDKHLALAELVDLAELVEAYPNLNRSVQIQTRNSAKKLLAVTPDEQELELRDYKSFRTL